MKTLDLKSKYFLIIGSEGYLGSNLRKTLEDEGAYIFGVDIKGANILDISDTSAVDKYIENKKSFHIKFDGVINCSTLSFKGKEISEEQFKKTMDTNVFGSYNIINKLIPLMNKNASIVNISSIYGHFVPDFDIYEGNEEWYSNISYGSSKAGIEYMTKYFAKLYAPMRFNCVSPGGIFNNHSDDFVSKYSERVALKRMADIREICDTILFLLSPMSSYITGFNINVDGGFNL